MGYVVALDQGTTSSRAVVYDTRAAVVASAQRELEQHYPRPGWVEHDPGTIWRDQVEVLGEALDRAGAGAGDVLALGITNQRETAIAWDRDTGEPICNAMVWQDRRTSSMCDELRARGLEPTFVERTGLVLDAYFSGTKYAWILEHVDGARALADAGRLALGTVDSWLLWKLTGGAIHATDVSNASRTLLMDVRTGRWDDELLGVFGIPARALPAIVGSSGEVGRVAAGLPGAGASISGIAGDQQASLMGNLCVSPGATKCTYGTGCFLLMHTGGEVCRSANRLLGTVAWRRGDETSYALEGGVFAGGAVVQWLRDGLGIVKSAPECSELAGSVPDAAGVVLVPAFAGLGAPHWDQDARGTLLGLTRGTTRAHICRAALESIACSVADLLGALRADAPYAFEELRVDGGASASDELLALQADLLGVPVVRAASVETTAAGAAYLAGLGAGVWSGVEELEGAAARGRVFEPRITGESRAARLEVWADAVERAKGWAQDD